MVIIHCKNCGGSVELSDDKTFGTCEYCGCTMTFPKVSDEQRAAAFNRGNHFRRIGEFDKALAVYERIVREDDTDAEAHWCCALSRFGIEYVEDPATFEWLPTCHRASFDNFLEDVDYLAAVEHSSGLTQRQYKKDGAKIAEVQRGILATSQNTEPFDVFICYKESDEQGNRTRDSLLAQDIYYQLTEQGRKVFFSRITLEDMVGTQYEPYIFAALNSAKVMIVVGTKAEYMNAVWVKNEWSRFLAMMKKDRSKILLPCYRDMDPYDMPEQLGVLQSYDMSKIGFIQDLTRGIAKVLDAAKKPEPAKETVVVQQQAGNNVVALLKRGNMALEDGEWDKADQFFEEVLNQDAECAEAYLGKALIGAKCSTVDQFVRKRQEAFYNTGSQTLQLERDHAHIQSAVEKYSLRGYVEQQEIRKLYDFQLTYSSSVDLLKQRYSEEEKYWANHKQLSRAEKFAKGAFAQELSTKKKELFSTLDQILKQAQTAEENAKSQLRQSYEAHLAKADEKAAERHRIGQFTKSQYYQSLVNVAKNTSDCEQLKRTAEKFDALGDYQDSKNMAQHCRNRLAEVKAKLAAEQEQLRIRRQKEAQARARANRRKTIFAVAMMVIIVAAVFVVTKVIIPSSKYEEAEKLMAAQKYEEAIAAFEELAGFRDSEDQIDSCREAICREDYDEAVSLMEAGKYEEAIEAFASIRGYRDSDTLIKACNYNRAVELEASGQYMQAFVMYNDADGYEDAYQKVAALRTLIVNMKVTSAGSDHSVAITAEGNVLATGYNSFGQCGIFGWTNIISIDAGEFFTVGLRADGTVVAVGRNQHTQCNVSGWTDIVAISAGGQHTVGLRSDGTVVAVGNNEEGQCNVSSWKDIVAISAGSKHTVGLKSDGTVVSVGSNAQGQLYMSKWTDIVMISAGGQHTVGLKADGTVVATGNNNNGQCEVSQWKSIMTISAGGQHTVAVKTDGTVVAVGSNTYGQCDVSSWTDVVLVSAGSFHTLGVRTDGTVIAIGHRQYNQCKVQGWTVWNYLSE